MRTRRGWVWVLGCLWMACAHAPPRAEATGVPFIEGDYRRALKEAQAKGVLLFVDVWAPWCHTCRFMRAHVFTDPALARHASRFVWLELDTERPQSAEFVEKFPVDAWPTLLFIDPATESVVFRWLGSAKPEQLIRMFDDAERAATAPPGGDETAEAALARADRLHGKKAFADAAAAYARAVAAAPVDWERRPRAVESWLNALAVQPDHVGCAATAEAHAPSLPRGPSFTNVVVLGLACASAVAPASAPGPLDALGEEAVRLPGLLADDRSSLYEVLVGRRRARGDAAGARVLAAQWLTFLEQEAQRAATAEARAAFDPHRVSAALAVGAPERALPPLLQSEKDLPNDYNPAARLALVYREMGQHDSALAAVERALGKVQGPRRLRVLETKASIQRAMGDSAAAQRTLSEALAYAQTLPAAQRPERLVAKLKAQLESR